MNRRLTLLFLLMMFLPPTRPVFALDTAEIFDIQQGKVVRSIPQTASLQREAGKWLKAVTERVPTLRVVPAQGIGIKIPLSPPQPLHQPTLQGTALQVILFISRDQTYRPTLLIFTKEKGVVAVHTAYDFRDFLKLYRLDDKGWNLKTSLTKSLKKDNPIIFE